MGWQVAGIWVRQARRLTKADVGDEIRAYWVGRGAKAESRRRKGAGALEVAVAIDDIWFYIADSTRVHADFSLANHLAERLRTRVCWYALDDDAAALRLLRPGRAMRLPRDDYEEVVDFLDRRTMRCWDFADIDERFRGVLHLHFSGVTKKRYDRGPPPR